MKENIENTFEAALCNFISDSIESDYDTGYWLSEILIKQIAISTDNFIAGFVDKINEFQAEKYGTHHDAT